MMGLFVGLLKWRSPQLKQFTPETTGIERSGCGIGEEAPIRTSLEDRLRRATFAHRIASVLSELSLREGRVFAIRGGWGYGKSSLKNLIAEALRDKDKRIDLLDFNPWQWGDGDVFVRALFEQMSDCLGGRHSKAAHNRAKALRLYGSILTGAGKSLKKVGSSEGIISTVLTNASVVAIASAMGLALPAVATIAAALAVLSTGVPLLGRAMLYFGRDRSNDSLDDVRRTLEARLRELERPLVVFVDDIDRLEPEQIRMLFRQVKANANLPNIIFLLLFQPSIVERALDSVSADDGRAFLEKIVQVNFDLPAVPASAVLNVFYEELAELVEHYATEENGFTQQRWDEVSASYIHPLLRNLRDVRRLMSSIAVHAPLHIVDGVFEVNIIDFLLLETIRVFEPGLHVAMFREQDLLLRDLGSLQSERDKARTEFDTFLQNVPEQNRHVVSDALKELFPNLEEAYGGRACSRTLRERWNDDKRVCASRFFPRYFELQTAVGEMSERRFIDFLEASATADSLSLAIRCIEEERLLTSLIFRMSESVHRLPVENAAFLLPEMFVLAQKVSDTQSGFLNSPYVAMWNATNQFLKRVPEDARGELALAALRRSKGLSIGSMLISLSDPAEREARDRGTGNLALDLRTVNEMKALWLELIRHRAAEDGSLIDETDLLRWLFRWEDYSGSLEEPRGWIDKVTQTDEGFLKVATKMMRQGSVYSAGNRVSTPYKSFEKSTVDELIGISVAKERCYAIDPAEFPEYGEVLKVLTYYLEIWLGIRPRDPFDPTFADPV
ncbi:KAP family P-loop NTPase fold protein [Alcaligenes faecalis]|uniref:NTPase n=1 Tax=Alcaligenes faecalis TaxID=511 RepID=A0A2U2BQ14_ALCFA|nr:P-loop NTPase fold protein [Alcaligenes faecalis]PWE16069.1 NTPase [Alcaligenes faecalis]